jgi:hypothetical protein
MLHPVAPRKIKQSLSMEYDIVFVHKNNNYENWIGVVNQGEQSSVYWKILDASPDNIKTGIQGNIINVEQIGNMLSLVTNDSIYYLLYQENNYRFMGELPQVPPISFKTTDPMKHIEYYFKDEYGSGNVTPENFILSTKGLVNKAIDVLVNGGVDENNDPIGGYGFQLFDACFVRYAFRLYDGSLTKYSPPILVMPSMHILRIKSIDYGFILGKLSDISRVHVHGYRIEMGYDFSGLDDWSDIIESVDIFLSPTLGISDIERNMNEDLSVADNISSQTGISLIKEPGIDELKGIEDVENFYFVRSINIGASASLSDPDVLPSTDLDIKNMQNLSSQERMGDDDFSNHKYGATGSYTYNNRLHISGIKTTLFDGFDFRYFQWNGLYNAYYTTPHPWPEIKWFVIVEINTGVSIEKVYAEYTGESSLLFSAFLSYPDPRARKITLYYDYGQFGLSGYFSANLQPHKNLNIAYYFDGLRAILNTVHPSIPIPPNIPTVSITEPNKIKVSALNNPLRFPNANVYQVGNGTILAMATNSMNVSDRNYGQYPLYIFTTQGVWTLNVGSGEVVYSSLTAPTHIEGAISKVICETPMGVVFITRKGLMLINGQAVEFMSPQLEQEPLDISLEIPTQADDVLLQFPGESFKEYLKDVDNMAYNPLESELIICGKEEDYNYVFSFQNNTFYQSTEKIDAVVKNTFPNLFVVGDSQLKDYSESNASQTHVSFILRPLLFGTEDIKKLERMILRGIIYNLETPVEGKHPIVMTHHSDDGVNYMLTRGITLKPANYKDIDMGLFSRSKYRRFIFTLAGMMDEKSQMSFLETMIEKEYDNTKMR